MNERYYLQPIFNVFVWKSSIKRSLNFIFKWQAMQIDCILLPPIAIFFIIFFNKNLSNQVREKVFENYMFI